MRIFSFPDHMLGWVPIAAKAGMEICRRKDVGLIYTTSPPHSTHLAGYFISKRAHKPWIADFRDPWTLNAYRGNRPIDKLLIKIEKKMEGIVLKKSSIILANTQSNRTNLLNNFQFLNDNKVIHLSNGWEEFPEAVNQNKRSKLYTIVHAGTFYPRFKPYALFYALAAWRKGTLGTNVPPFNKNIQIILLGANDSETNSIVNNLNLNDMVQMRPWVRFSEARRIMRRADLLWASLGFNKISSTYIPSKLYEYIAAERPILGFFPEGEASNLIKSTGTGIVFNNNDNTKLIRIISEAILLKGNREPNWFKPNKDVIFTYNIKMIISRFDRILRTLLKSNTEKLCQ
jgi:glycosyltransferase involved in cell wall biosynthesis